MPNRRRGEVELALGARRFTLCLTLGALAELEAAFGVADLAALGQRFSSGRLSAGDLIRILAAGLRGAGHAMGEDEVAALPVAGGIETYARAVCELLEATFGAAQAPAPNPPGRRKGGAP